MEDGSLFSNVLTNKEISERYNRSIQSFKLLQIRIITILTGILYIIYSQVDKYVLPNDIIHIASSVHLYVLAPILFFISFFTFFPKYYTYIINILIIAPLFATVTNLILIRNLESFTIYMTEIYLIIFWVFTISGLKLKESSISVFLVSLITFINYYFIFPLPQKLFIMHSFWMLCVISFGFVGAFLLERLSKRNFVNYVKLEKSAETDALTGLYNRTKLDEVLQSELDRSKRFNHNFSFILIDIDYFKNINDTYGHQVGDSFLIEFTNLVNSNSRSTDLFFRWGGEEFVLLCLEVDKEKIHKYLENLRQKIEQHKFKSVDKKTVSIGLTISKNEDDINSIVKRADEALYLAKNNGRNQVVFI